CARLHPRHRHGQLQDAATRRPLALRPASLDLSRWLRPGAVSSRATHEPRRAYDLDRLRHRRSRAHRRSRRSASGLALRAPEARAVTPAPRIRQLSLSAAISRVHASGVSKVSPPSVRYSVPSLRVSEKVSLRSSFSATRSRNVGSRRQTSIASSRWIGPEAASASKSERSTWVYKATRTAALAALCRRRAEGAPMSIQACRAPLASTTESGGS